jgi:exopolysaccharide biosynthesis WecB/TagA/CpsF family protein
MICLTLLAASLSIVVAIVGTAVAVLCVYLLIVALASLTAGSRPARPANPPAAPRSRLSVIVPAHNEADLVGRCVSSLLKQDYPRELYKVVVVADNCSDQTAAAAAASGAAVLVRSDPLAFGKGHAIRWAMDRIITSPEPPDGIAVVDADSVADPGLLRGLESVMAGGAGAVQADYTALARDGSARQELTALGLLLFHRVRLAGRARLHLAANLVGNGMLFSRGLLERHPWDAFTGAEDLEFTVRLRLAGARPAYAAGAVVQGPLASARGSTEQRLRWEGGRFHVMRGYLWRLIAACATGPSRPWDMALDLAVPPLGLLGVVTSLGLGLAAALARSSLTATWPALIWLGAAIALVLFVLIGMVGARAPASAWRALGAAPIFVAWKLLTYSKLLRGFDPHRWVRADRDPADRPALASREINLFGVPISMVDMPAALERISDSLGAPGLYHVATVNMDFITSSQRERDVRAALGRTQLNVPDGAPVVWLMRLLGHRASGRVAGADLVPLLLERLADRGGSVFLLGGEGGVAQAAAARIQERWPGVMIAGCHEPARAAIDEMDNTAIISQIASSGAQLLLVALGHPKQELWIDRHRDQLPVSTAIGVGCVFDLLAGRVVRAPLWMRRANLEWAYRLMREPGRLAHRYQLNARWLFLLAARALLYRWRGGSLDV